MSILFDINQTGVSTVNDNVFKLYYLLRFDYYDCTIMPKNRLLSEQPNESWNPVNS